jgi:hypothetical protein
MVTALRLDGDKQGKGKGGKDNGDDNEGGKVGKGGKAMVTVTRVAGEQTAMATKRAMATKTRVGGAGGGND